MPPKKPRTVKTPAEEQAAKRTCVWEDAVPKGVSDMLRIAPGNPTIRAQLLAAVKVPLPDDVTTFEAIVKWVEHNVKKKPPYDPEGIAFNLNCTFYAHEWVRAKVRLDVDGSTQVPFTIKEVVEEAREYVNEVEGDGERPNWDEFMSRMNKLLEEKTEEFNAATVEWSRPTHPHLEEVENVGNTPQERYQDFQVECGERLSDSIYSTLSAYAKDLLRALGG